MRAAVLRRPGDLSIEEIEEPGCPEGGAVIRVTACAVCPTDIKMFRSGQRDLSYPRVLGHEVVGRVEHTRSPRVHDGDLVQVWPGVACGTCPSCLRGWDNLCSHQGIIGFNHDGGFAELMAIPSRTIERGGVNVISSGVDAAMVSLTEPLACCVHGQRAAMVSEDDKTTIFGGGPMGLMHAALCKMRGSPAMVVEPDMDRRGMALLMGAERVIDPTKVSVPEEIAAWTSHRGADVAILATPQVRVDGELMKMMAPRGRICVFSGLPKTEPWSTVDLNLLHYRELSAIGAYGCTSDSDREALRLLVRGEIDLSPLISRRMPLGEIEDAFKLIEERQALKCVIDDLTR